MAKKIKYIKILLILFLIYFCYYRYLVWWGYPVLKYSPKWISADVKTDEEEVKKILLWTNHYWIPPEERIKSLNAIQNCPKKCLYVADKTEVSNVHAVLFHSNADNLDLNALPLLRHPKQNYIFFTQESPPKAARKNLHQIWRHFPKHFFNLTMTYRLDSDVIASYDKFIEITNEKTDQVYAWNEVESAVSKKNQTALQFVGNCYSESGRERIVRGLKAFIDVDQYGYCSGRKCDKTCEDKIIGNYYFFLAFENNICTDYTTEKFWRIKKLIVPIVLRRSIASQIAPNHSFIAVDDFKTVGRLADHLNYLMQNKTAYLEYFKWTKIYQKRELSWEYPYCKLCERINNNHTFQSYENINEWFDASGTCKIAFLNEFFEILILWRKTSLMVTFSIIASIILIWKIAIKKLC